MVANVIQNDGNGLQSSSLACGHDRHAHATHRNPKAPVRCSDRRERRFGQGRNFTTMDGTPAVSLATDDDVALDATKLVSVQPGGLGRSCKAG